MSCYPPCRCITPTVHSQFGPSHCGWCGGMVPQSVTPFKPVPDKPVTTIKPGAGK